MFIIKGVPQIDFTDHPDSRALGRNRITKGREFTQIVSRGECLVFLLGCEGKGRAIGYWFDKREQCVVIAVVFSNGGFDPPFVCSVWETAGHVPAVLDFLDDVGSSSYQVGVNQKAGADRCSHFNAWARRYNDFLKIRSGHFLPPGSAAVAMNLAGQANLVWSAMASSPHHQRNEYRRPKHGLPPPRSPPRYERRSGPSGANVRVDFP